MVKIGNNPIKPMVLKIIWKKIKKILAYWKTFSIFAMYLITRVLIDSQKIKKMRTINIHMISISNWRRNSHPSGQGMFNCDIIEFW